MTPPRNWDSRINISYMLLAIGSLSLLVGIGFGMFMGAAGDL